MGDGVEVRQRVELVWVPEPRLQLVVVGPDGFWNRGSAERPQLHPDTWSLPINGTEVLADGVLWTFTEEQERVICRVRPTTIGESDETLWVHAKVVNLSITNADDFVTLTAEGWVLLLEDLGADPMDMPTDPRDYVVTHRARLFRDGYAPFTSEEGLDVLDAFDAYASMCRGAWCGVVLPVGHGTHSRVTWRRLEAARIDHSGQGSSWAIQTNAGPKPFVEMWPGFLHRWQNGDMRSTLQTIVELGIESDAHTSGEAALLIAEVALELLSWVAVVGESAMMTAEGHDRLGPSDRLRLLLALAGQDRALPNHADELRKLAARRGWADGPHAIVELRNLIAHPNKRQKIAGLTRGAVDNCRRLALWYSNAALYWLFTRTVLVDDVLHAGGLDGGSDEDSGDASGEGTVIALQRL
jgi:hypothetical protein